MGHSLTNEVKRVAKEAGADLAGIGPMDRFEGGLSQWGWGGRKLSSHGWYRVHAK